MKRQRLTNIQVPSADTQNAIDEQTRCWSTEACDGSTVSSVAVQRKQSDEEDANGRGMSHALHQWLGQKPKQEPWAPFPAPEAGAASSENTSKKKQGKAMNRQRTNACKVSTMLAARNGRAGWSRSSGVSLPEWINGLLACCSAWDCPRQDESRFGAASRQSQHGCSRKRQSQPATLTMSQ